MTFGVYVHVPFCAHRCDYCAFATYSDRDHLMDAYVDAVLTEIASAQSAGSAHRDVGLLWWRNALTPTG